MYILTPYKLQIILKRLAYFSGVTSLLEQATNFLKTGLGLITNSLCSSCTGCRHGNLLLTGIINKNIKKC